MRAPESRARGPLVRYARLAGLAFDFAGAILAGALVGWMLDRWLGTAPYLLMVSTLAGVIGGFVRLVRVARRFERLDREAEP